VFAHNYTSSFGCSDFQGETMSEERAYQSVRRYVSDERRSCSQKSGNPEGEKRILGDFVIDAHLSRRYVGARSHRLKLT